VFGLAVLGIGRVWIEVIGSTAGMLDGSCVEAVALFEGKIV